MRFCIRPASGKSSTQTLLDTHMEGSGPEPIPMVLRNQSGCERSVWARYNQNPGVNCRSRLMIDDGVSGIVQSDPVKPGL